MPLLLLFSDACCRLLPCAAMIAADDALMLSPLRRLRDDFADADFHSFAPLHCL